MAGWGVMTVGGGVGGSAHVNKASALLKRVALLTVKRTTTVSST